MERNTSMTIYDVLGKELVYEILLLRVWQSCLNYKNHVYSSRTVILYYSFDK